MSNDGYINSALFNFCTSLDNGPKQPTEQPPRSLEDIAWLKEALQSVEAPDKTMKKKLGILKRCVKLPSTMGKISSSATPLMLSAGPSKSIHTSSRACDTVNVSECPTETSTPPQQLKEDYPEKDELISSLEYLECELEDINMSTEFCLMDGPAIMLELLRVTAFDTQNSDGNPAAADAEVRYLVAMCIAHATQQHPKAQECFVALSWESVVVPMLALEVGEIYNGFTRASKGEVVTGNKGNVTVDTIAALIHICSCMSRECDHGSRGFITNGGLDIINFILTTTPNVNSSSGSSGIDKQLSGPFPCYMLCTPKIVKRLLFLVEYFASIGISNTAIIVNLCDMTGVIALDGTERSKTNLLYVEVLEKVVNNPVLIAEQARQVAAAVYPDAITSSSSLKDNSAASNSNIDDGLDNILSEAGNKCVITCSRSVKNDLQISICQCLNSLLHSGKDVVKGILHSRNVGTFLECYLTEAAKLSFEGVALSVEEDPRKIFCTSLLK
eukprot:Tbor_TRINITY_DN3340_c0_g1::TRINITY_DN3340_c0_g1_i1::g.23555::m.23555